MGSARWVVSCRHERHLDRLRRNPSKVALGTSRPRTTGSFGRPEEEFVLLAPLQVGGGPPFAIDESCHGRIVVHDPSIREGFLYLIRDNPRGFAQKLRFAQKLQHLPKNLMLNRSNFEPVGHGRRQGTERVHLRAD